MPTRKTSPRSQRTDGEATRARLLEAGGRLFARQGFAETTSKAVALAAGVDLALINYHFGNRNGLYQAVLLEAHQGLVGLADLRRIADADISGEERLRKLIDGIVRRGRKADTWYPRVLAREIMAPTSHLAVLLEKAVPPKLQFLRRILGDVSGIPPDDPAILRCLLNVLAPCMMLVVIDRDMPSPLQRTLRTPHKTLVDHLHTFAVAGLKAIGAAHRPRGTRRR